MLVRVRSLIHQGVKLHDHARLTTRTRTITAGGGGRQGHKVPSSLTPYKQEVVSSLTT